MAQTTTINPDITMRELLGTFPGARRALFVKYHIGGCSSCGFSLDETLSQLCLRNENIPVDEVIDHIQRSHDEDLKIQVTPAELAEQLKAGTVKLFDVRTREEYEAVHIEGAALFNQQLMQEIMGGWDKATHFVIADHTGTRSMDAVAFFIGHGFANVKALRGGIDAWSQEVDPSLSRYELE